MNITKLAVLLISLLWLVSGCATMPNAREEKGKGVAYIYEGSFDQVWTTVPKAMRSLGPFPPRILENNLEEAYISGQGDNARARSVSFNLSGMLTDNTSGQNILVFVEKLDENRTKVEVVSEPALITKVLAANWSPRIHRKLSESFKRVQ